MDTSTNHSFRGFLIQARTASDGSAVGRFDSGAQHQQVCTNEVCIIQLLAISCSYVTSICVSVNIFRQQPHMLIINKR